MELQFDTVQDTFQGFESEGRTEHKDIALIAPNDGIIINRTKNRISPFVDIRKDRLSDSVTGKPTNTFGVWVEDAEEEGGWRSCGVVSENYLLLPNRKVRELALTIAEESGLAYRESRIFWDGSRFAHIIDFHEVREEVTEGDEVGLSLITRNSYDKTWKYDCALMGKHFICDNGALSGEFFARVSFKHLGGSSDQDAWEQVVKDGLSVIGGAGDNLQRYVRGLRTLNAMKMDDALMRKVWNLTSGIGDSIRGKILTRYVQKEEPTAYGLLQAGTYTLWHDQKATASNFQNNDIWVTSLLNIAENRMN